MSNDFDINNFEDPEVWDLICSGRTKGVFQLESNLGRHWAKQLKPRSISELSALISLIRPGCISGDTKITVSSYTHKDGNVRFIRKTMKELFLNKAKYNSLFSVDQNHNIVTNNVSDIFYSGEKECFKVAISKRPNRKNSWKQPAYYDLECTKDHKLLRSDGEWVELQYLKLGDRIAILKKRGPEGQRKKLIANRHAPSADKVENAQGLKYFKEICFKHYHYKCCICGWNKCSLDTHHIQGNRHTDNSPQNLAFLCPNCHRMVDGGLLTSDEIVESREKLRLPQSNDIEWAEYMGRESVGVKDTYDITMDGPNHNFIAGGFVVHNCLKAYTDGKSMTQHYVDRKAGKDAIIYPHDSLEDILEETYGVLVYQEQSMIIAQKLAGFNLAEADSLRKAIGKKKAALMAEVKKSFIEGAKKLNIVTPEIANEIFSWIEKSNRYAFNKSHAVSYAINAYWSAYCKNYKMIEFYTSYLNHSERKPDSQREIKELVVDAKSNDIEVYPPRLGHIYTDFTQEKNKIFFGTRHIKNVGAAECKKLEEIVSEKDISDYSWLECLVEIIHKKNINKRSVISLISVGAFNGKNNTEHRKKMLYEFDSWKQLSAREQEYISENYSKFNTLYECINDMITNFKITSNRRQSVVDINNSLKNPFYSLEDSITTMAQDEDKYLGCPLTCSKTDAVDSSISTIMCKDIANGVITGKANVVVSITSVRQYKTKRGKNPGQLMAFVCGEDSSGMLDSITVFPEQYSEFKDLLTDGNTVLINGEISKKEKTSIIVNKVTQV